MKPLEIVKIDTLSASCSGKRVPLDHPNVYLHIDPAKGFVECPYCSKRFEKSGS